MKNIFLIISLLIVNFMFSGCSTKTAEPKKNVIQNVEGVTKVLIYKDINLKQDEFKKSEHNNYVQKNYRSDNLMLKQALELVSLEAIKNGKTNFIIINDDTNNLRGFPINNYRELNKFCLNYNRDTSLEIKCSVFKEGEEVNMALFKFIILDEVNYKIASFNAKDVLEELKKETQPIN